MSNCVAISVRSFTVAQRQRAIYKIYSQLRRVYKSGNGSLMMEKLCSSNFVSIYKIYCKSFKVFWRKMKGP